MTLLAVYTLLLASSTWHRYGRKLPRITPIQTPAGTQWVARARADSAMLRSYAEWLDSMKKVEEGQLVYDSLVKDRPGLFDSILRQDSLLRHRKTAKP